MRTRKVSRLSSPRSSSGISRPNSSINGCDRRAWSVRSLSGATGDSLSMAAGTRIALVTGGNRGIGLEICRQLAAKGHAVVLTARDTGKGKAAAKALQEEGLAVEFQRLDVTSCRSIRACVAAVAERRSRIDVLVHNAGVLLDSRGSRFLDSKLDTYRDTLETNLFGPLQLAQSVVPLMKAIRYGRIVNLSSGMGQLTEMSTGSPAYRLSKTALNALTRI